jgi:hypothetical protein
VFKHAGSGSGAQPVGHIGEDARDPRPLHPRDREDSAVRGAHAVGVPLLALLATAGCGAGGGDLPVLRGEVGEADRPDAYTMSLTDGAGRDVTSLPAGEYRLVVTDHSPIHNFHLRGPAAEESTSVVGTGESTWTVTLAPGEHSYVCDPHPGMTESFTVT